MAAPLQESRSEQPSKTSEYGKESNPALYPNLQSMSKETRQSQTNSFSMLPSLTPILEDKSTGHYFLV
jgi:hypothetical protein